MITCSKERMEDKIVTFSKFGDTGKGGVTRLSMSPEAIQARGELCKRCKALGMEIKTDDMANIYATIPGEEGLPAIAMGSHLDSVIQGGNYDGVLGVLTAMEVAETIVAEKIEHRHPITVVVWTNEEGARFEPALMSSGVISGKFDKADMLVSADKKGTTFAEALEASGYKGDESNRMTSDNYKAFLELHIEQGPVLEDKKIDIGTVEGVVGMVNYEIFFKGQSGHAGTTPMAYRKDALYAACKIIQYLHDELDKLDSNLVYTTGRMDVKPGIHTVIPDDVSFSLDARHQNPDVIQQVVEVVERIPKEVEKCEAGFKLNWRRKTTPFNTELVDYVEKNAKEYGYSNMRLYSGPGHDAQYMADVLPTTMIFVPSVGGHSHCEIEYTPVENCWKGANVLLQTVLDVDKK
ncbi:Zn-dependent hydrolase [Metaclostridioides mangenotii]|uniref:Zn-dependent hydrolase n=1 Tax=Metaclostridioides mangenotii TaxID=1540 RepID=UPI0028E4B1C9|nr:Zn-dependent hydrolase [Clostridioides mangenotii]